MADLALDGLGGLASSPGRSDDSESESPELLCIGCGASSKDDCPVAKKLKKKERIAWGKASLRGKGSSKRKVKRRCGEWCLICHNIARKKIQSGKYKKADSKYK
jgi:hypothetical protein